VVIVFNNPRDRSTRVDAQCLQFDLLDLPAVDEQNDVVAMVAVIGVSAVLLFQDGQLRS